MTSTMPTVTPAQAESLFGIPAERVYRWRSRGKLIVRETRGRSELFAVDDLRMLNDKATADPRSGKRSVPA